MEGNKPNAVSDMQRQRAPVITVDHSERTAVSSASTSESSVGRPPIAQPLPSRESRPSSLHTFASRTSDWKTQNFLSVPGVGSHRATFDSPTTNTNNEEFKRCITDEDALRPDPGTEADFEVDNNRFRFTPGQLGKMYNPKSLSAFYALGGLEGLEKGLRTDCRAGLSVDEVYVEDDSVMADSANEGRQAKPERRDRHTAPLPGSSGTPISGTRSLHLGEKRLGYIDRRHTFSDNKLPLQRQSLSARLGHALQVVHGDKVLLLLASVLLFVFALGLYEAQGLDWVEGVAILLAVIIVIGIGAAIDWTKERQFAKLNKKKEDRTVKVIRSGKTREISVYDVLVGDVVHLEPGDLIPVDGILIRGHGVKCDESSATGESDPIKKTGADDISDRSIGHFDPFIVSGARVLEGIGTFMVAATGKHSTYGKTMMSIRQDDSTTKPRHHYTLSPLFGFTMLLRCASIISEHAGAVFASPGRGSQKRMLPVPSYLRGLSRKSKNGTSASPSKPKKSERPKLKDLHKRRTPVQPASLSTWSIGTRTVSLFRPKRSILDIFTFSLLVAKTNADSSGEPSHTTWRQRALSKLTEALISCAFLVAPTVIVVLAGGIAVFLSNHKKEGSAVTAMLVSASISVTIGQPSNTERRDEDRFIQLAVGMSYAMFMLVYCKLVMSRNDGGKGFCFIAAGLGVLSAAVAMIFASVRDYWSEMTRHDPLLAVFVTVPLSFTLCDLALYIAHAVNNHGVEREPSLLPSPTPGPRQVLRGPQYFSLERLRRRNQSLLHSETYDEDAEDFDSAAADGAFEQEQLEPTAPRSTSHRCFAWIGGLFGKRKPL